MSAAWSGFKSLAVCFGSWPLRLEAVLVLSESPRQGDWGVFFSGLVRLSFRRACAFFCFSCPGGSVTKLKQNWAWHTADVHMDLYVLMSSHLFRPQSCGENVHACLCSSPTMKAGTYCKTRRCCLISLKSEPCQ